MGKPLSTSYSDDEKGRIVDHVLAELSAGIPISRTLNADREEWLCSERCFWNWYYAADASDENGLVQKVARARDNGVEAMVDKAINVAETPQLGEIVTIERDPEHQKDVEGGAEVKKLDGSPYGGMVVKVRKEDMLGHRKLVVDTLFKAAQMLKPKKYGARTLVGSDPDNPLPPGFNVNLVKGADA
jgi:hypothetical protein